MQILMEAVKKTLPALAKKLKSWRKNPNFFLGFLHTHFFHSVSFWLIKKTACVFFFLYALFFIWWKGTQSCTVFYISLLTFSWHLAAADLAPKTQVICLKWPHKKAEFFSLNAMCDSSPKGVFPSYYFHMASDYLPFTGNGKMATHAQLSPFSSVGVPKRVCLAVFGPPTEVNWESCACKASTLSRP